MGMSDKLWAIQFANLIAVLPAIVVMVTGFIVLLGDSCVPTWHKNGKALNPAVTFVGIAVALFFNMTRIGKETATAFSGAVVDDPFSRIAILLLGVAAILAVLLSTTYLENKKLHHGEYYVLILFSLFGAMLMASSNELITLFVSIETLSVSLYVLAGFARTEERSEEAALKYFLLGAFAAGFLLYGIALVYGGSFGLSPTGKATTNLTEIGAGLASAGLGGVTVMFVIGVALMFVGFAFKAALVPFHMWTPDVYQGSPTSVTAYMAALTKIAIFTVILRILSVLTPISSVWLITAQILAVLTMFGGNILAVTQDNVKRMLAYSSVAHAGYIMAAVVAVGVANGKFHDLAINATMFYLFAYTLMTIGAFGVLIWLSRRGRDCQTLGDLKGLVKRDPVGAYTMLVFMLSLGGIPPTMGFMGKLMIFNVLLSAGLMPLALCLGFASIISVYYYLRVVWMMCFMEPDKETITDHAVESSGALFAIGVTVVLSLFFGLAPTIAQNLLAPATNILVR
ncbi:MAG: NADH-quinone oxidoreductase subunit N [Armatimonadetes bacterium]|nr:NADH-quinone oxidoreductase subunit N [Armatimonadota bacterium]